MKFKKAKHIMIAMESELDSNEIVEEVWQQLSHFDVIKSSHLPFASVSPSPCAFIMIVIIKMLLMMIIIGLKFDSLSTL